MTQEKNLARTPAASARRRSGKSCRIAPKDAKEYGERFNESEWGCVGHIFAYRHPEGTQFEAHPSPEVSDERWISMLKAPVFGTGLTYKEKIMCRMTGLTYEEYLALKNKDAITSRELEPCGAQVSETRWSAPSINQTAGTRSSQDATESTMKGEIFDRLPKHRCKKTGSPRIGFAPIDPAVVEAMIDRAASSAEVYAQVRVWIEADAAKDPDPIDTNVERFRAAMVRNIPFAIYCRQCLELGCLIHPEEMKDYDVQN